MLQGPEQLVDGPWAERIPTLGAVERDPDRPLVQGAVVGDVVQVLEAGDLAPERRIEDLGYHGKPSWWNGDRSLADRDRLRTRLSA